MSAPAVTAALELSPVVAWSRRVRRVGGFIQVAFAAFWLTRGSLIIHGRVGAALAVAFGVSVVAASIYGIRATAGTAPRPASVDARRIERAVTIATIIHINLRIL